MKKFLKRLGLLLGLFLLLLFGGLSLLLTFFQDNIGRQVVTTVNAQLTTEMRVGSFDLSLLRTFPNIGINLQEVVVQGTDGEPLIEAGELSFRAGLFSLLGSALELKSVVLQDAALRLAVDRRGQSNYDILRDTEDDATQTSNTRISLGEAIVRNLEITYADEQAEQAAQLQVEQATFTGDFGSSRFRLESEAETQISLLESAGERLLQAQAFSYEAAVDVDSRAGKYILEQVAVELGGLPLELAGSVQQQDQATTLDLQFSSSDGTLSEVLALLPGSYREPLQGIESRGDFSLNGTIQGTYAARQRPAVAAELRFADGRLSGERVLARVRDLGFVATFTQDAGPDSRSARLRVADFRGEMDGEPFAMQLQIDNLDDPSIDFQVNGSLPPGLLMGFIPDERITDAEGMIYIRNLHLRGRYEDMIRTSRLGRVQLDGVLDFAEAGFTVNGEEVMIVQGQVSLQDQLLRVQAVELEAPGTRLVFQGEASNVLPVIFSDSLNSQAAQLEFAAELRADYLDIDQLLALGAPAEAVQEAAEAAGQTDSLAQAEVGKRAFFTSFLNGRFAADIKAFNYDRIEGENFTGELTFTPGQLHIEGRTEAMEGEFLLDGELRFTERPELTAKLTANKISAYEFFEQSDNFGQDVLVADNLDGELDARLYIEAHFDEQNNFLAEELEVLGGIGIHDGALRNFKMLEDFSTFVNVRDLRDIRFSNLENFFEIRNRKLYLPVMFIQSNALNLTISGEHTFDQDIAYYLKVNAGQVMADRFRRHDRKLRPKPARRDGFFNLYYAILGDIENFNIVSDKRRVQRDFEESDRRRRDIHYALERAFGTVIELVDEPIDWRDIPEYEEDPDSEEPEFLDMEIEGGK
jgi:hypothetical protein